MMEIIQLRPIWGCRTRTLTSSLTTTSSPLLPFLNQNKPTWHRDTKRPNKRKTRLVGRFQCAIAKESSPTTTAAPPARGLDVDCVIVGAGISGLCIAQVLATKHADAGLNVVVTEARDRVGGNITTVERDGYLWEEGPNSFQPSDLILTISVGVLDLRAFEMLQAERCTCLSHGNKEEDEVVDDTGLERVQFHGGGGIFYNNGSALKNCAIFDNNGFDTGDYEFCWRIDLHLCVQWQIESGLKDDLVLGDPNAPRFVLWGGKLRPVPAKPTDLPFFDLMSFPGKLRAGFGALGIRPPPPGHEESVEEFVRRNLGDEVFERLIEPFCSGGNFWSFLTCRILKAIASELMVIGAGVYAGDPSKLSMKAAFGKVWKLEQTGGSIIGGTFKAIQERNSTPKPPRDPLGRRVKLSWKLTAIKKLDGGGYQLSYETPEGLVSLQSKSVVMTVPSHVASTLLRPLSAAAADALSRFYYPPVAAVTISYTKEAIRGECLIDGELKGFGQLHPRSQGVETLGTIYSSSLFPNRAPPGRILLLNYIGGATNPEIVSKVTQHVKNDYFTCKKMYLMFYSGTVAVGNLGHARIPLPYGTLMLFFSITMLDGCILGCGTVFHDSCKFPSLLRFPSPRSHITSSYQNKTKKKKEKKKKKISYSITESELVETVDLDLRKMLLNPNAKDPEVLGVRVWPQAIPQFLVGHLDILDAAKNALSSGGFHGLFLGGNYVSGVALGRCVEGAYDVAAEVNNFLSQYVYN
ncbi:Amine oxidase [Dillenia turbinata]|uniref:protoporphyrinogen oxidase n=1 Tax=Dillenia turbinata TaxID=194707 RepID=A0AAN8ZNT7_9MAGN